MWCTCWQLITFSLLFLFLFSWCEDEHSGSHGVLTERVLQCGVHVNNAFDYMFFLSLSCSKPEHCRHRGILLQHGLHADKWHLKHFHHIFFFSLAVKLSIGDIMVSSLNETFNMVYTLTMLLIICFSFFYLQWTWALRTSWCPRWMWPSTWCPRFNAFDYIFSFLFLTVNLSIADIMVSSLNVTFNVVYMLTGHWPFGNIYCKVSSYISILSVCGSVFTLVAISVERWEERPTGCHFKR